MPEETEGISPDTEQERLFQQRVDAEFTECLEERLKLYRNELIKLSEIPELANPDENIDEEVEKKREREMTEDFTQKVSYFTNNFYCWWPDGLYRTGEIPINVSSEKAKKLLSDLDKVIVQLQEEGSQKLVTTTNVKDPQQKIQRMRVIAKVYFALRDRGYERSYLTK